MKNTIDVCVLIYGGRSEKCLQILGAVDYPKDLLRITVYSDREIIHPYEHRMMPEADAWNHARNTAKGSHVWFMSADYILQSTSVLKNLLATEKDVVAGLLMKRDSNFSNFWGALSESGWYARSENYLSIVERKSAGIFEVPYITGNVLIKTEALKKCQSLTDAHENWDLDMNICHNLRQSGAKLHLLNDEVYGYIDESNAEPQENPLGAWAENENYLHPQFKAFMADRSTEIFKELGPDIWQFPIFREEFCDFLVNYAAEKGEWSAGIYSRTDEVDKRLGAVENFPTQDIHLKDIGLHDWWLNKVVGEYFKAVLSHLYQYKTKGYNIAFIVKYQDPGQTKLEAHHDASTYTTNIALNTYGVDYTGGGCNFVHKNVKCIGNLKGHLIMHPGRITHFHEAYPVTSGTRYILVSFNE